VVTSTKRFVHSLKLLRASLSSGYGVCTVFFLIIPPFAHFSPWPSMPPSGASAGVIRQGGAPARWFADPITTTPKQTPGKRGPHASTPICALTHFFDLLIVMVVIKLLLLVAMVVIKSSVLHVVFFPGAIALLLCPE